MSRVPKIGFNETVISIGTGSWQVPEHYKYLVREFRNLGYHAIAPLLGTDDLSINLNGVAKQMAAAESEVGAEHITRFLHSSAQSYGVRETDHIDGIVLYAGGVDKSIYPFNETEKMLLPEEERNTEEFNKGYIYHEGTFLTHINEAVAARVLYSGCRPADIEWTVANLRGKVRSPEEPRLETLRRELVKGYIGNVFDLAVQVPYQRVMPRLVYNLETDWLSTGHSGNIEAPRQLSELTVEIINRPRPRFHVDSENHMSLGATMVYDEDS